jgi:hypothetical protein
MQHSRPRYESINLFERYIAERYLVELDPCSECPAIRGFDRDRIAQLIELDSGISGILIAQDNSRSAGVDNHLNASTVHLCTGDKMAAPRFPNPDDRAAPIQAA